ncbi:MAG: monovalent cation/H+ antiporter subunit D family protein [Thermodesulfobacteriota bacterium]|nr:monovalent cation/H+ antiporter subunit D family protein [Thermodesulfobacteriota bacterium]
MIGLVEHLPILTIVISLFSAFTILIVGWFNKKSCVFITILTLMAQFIMSVLILTHVLDHGPLHYWLGGWKPPWGIELVVDPLNAYILIILLFLGFVCAIYSKSNIEHELPEKRASFYTLFQLLIAGLCGVTMTGDIFNMFVFIEIFSISAYALIAARGKIALKASFTYLILGSVGTCFFLLGIGFLYSITGSLNIHDLSILLPPFYGNKVVKAAFVFFVVGLSIKMALFPFHTWLPDAHAFAPAEISAMLSGIIIEVATYAFIRVAFSVFTVPFLKLLPVFDILCWVAVAAIIMGSVMAITQVNLKRMLAYSSVANMGYIMLAVGLSMSAVESPWGGLNPALMHIVNHALMKGCLFLAAGAFIYKADLWHITEFRGLARKMPYTCAAFVLAAISMIGIPPSVGFASKLYIILASIETRNFFFVAVLLISSLLNLVYFWRVIETMYMKQEGDGHHSHSLHGTREEIPPGMLIPILLLSSLCIVMGVLWLAQVPIPMLDQVNLMFGLGKIP